MEARSGSDVNNTSQIPVTIFIHFEARKERKKDTINCGCFFFSVLITSNTNEKGMFCASKSRPKGFWLVGSTRGWALQHDR